MTPVYSKAGTVVTRICYHHVPVEIVHDGYGGTEYLVLEPDGSCGEPKDGVAIGYPVTWCRSPADLKRRLREVRIEERDKRRQWYARRVVSLLADNPKRWFWYKFRKFALGVFAVFTIWVTGTYLFMKMLPYMTFLHIQ